MTPTQASELSQPALEACINYYFDQNQQFAKKAKEMEESFKLLVAEFMVRTWEKQIEAQINDESK